MNRSIKMIEKITNFKVNRTVYYSNLILELLESVAFQGRDSMLFKKLPENELSGYFTGGEYNNIIIFYDEYIFKELKKNNIEAWGDSNNDIIIKIKPQS